MASILAIVSKKVFERDFRVEGGQTAKLGDVVATAELVVLTAPELARDRS